MTWKYACPGWSRWGRTSRCDGIYPDGCGTWKTVALNPSNRPSCPAAGWSKSSGSREFASMLLAGRTWLRCQREGTMRSPNKLLARLAKLEARAEEAVPPVFRYGWRTPLPDDYIG